MAGGRLRKAMIEAIRSNRDRLDALEQSPYTLCEAAPVTLPPCVAIGPKGGCLITPRHAIHAAHYPLRAGDIVTYEWGQRTVVAVSVVTGTDLAVATLDEPADCEPALTLPWDWSVTLRTDRYGERLRRPIRCLGTKGNGEVVEGELRGIGQNYGASGPWGPGDSGQPVWLPLERPVVIGCHHLAGYGPAVHHYWREVARITGADGVAAEEAVW